jgi:hypothetical protein
MRDASSYWSPVCELVSDLRCWVRVTWQSDGKTLEGRWGQLLTTPTQDYLEAPGGQVSIKDVEYVDISTKRIIGGIAGRPRQMVDITDDILSAVDDTLTWELREGIWSVEGVFDREPVQVFRVLNPFGPTLAKPS